jgi:hypothetical protein
MLLSSPAMPIQFISTITHEGKVLVFGVDHASNIWYTVKQDGFELSYSTTKTLGWEDWKPLPLPGHLQNPVREDKSVIEQEIKELTYVIPGDTTNRHGTFILHSVYDSVNQTSLAPIQLISGMGHIYIFRQSKNNTLLVDRFVLNGSNNQLIPKLEVRFKRSCQKYAPLQKSSTQFGYTAKERERLTQIDSLDFRDALNQGFYEATSELNLVKPLTNGWFSVVLAPTIEADKYRWHIFVCKGDKIIALSIRASNERLFDLQDYMPLESQPSADFPIPGIVRQDFTLASGGEEIKATGAPIATKYDVQQEKEQLNPQTRKVEKILLRTATRIMVTVPTGQGNVATLNFSLTAYGLLVPTSGKPVLERLRGEAKAVLLPANSLENLEGLAPQVIPERSKILGLTESGKGKIQISTVNEVSVQDRSLIKIQNTRSYDGQYKVTKIDDDTFKVSSSAAQSELGNWEVLPTEADILTFNGKISGFERLDDNTLKVICQNHQLKNDDNIQITGTGTCNGIYAVRNSENDHFEIDLRWQAGAAVNLKQIEYQRRGVVFDGQGDLITDNSDVALATNTFMIEAWINPIENHKIELANQTSSSIKNAQKYVVYPQKNSLGKAGVGFSAGCNGVSIYEQGSTLVPSLVWAGSLSGWTHVAIAYNQKCPQLYINGQLVCSGTPSANTDVYPCTQFGGGEKGYFKGRVAEIRIWSTNPEAKIICDRQYLQLTGQEAGLVGYWRCHAIAEGQPRIVTDFSVNRRDGIVQGDTHVSPVEYPRSLNDGQLLTQYRNAELFPVSQGASYEESFEFKLIPNENVTDTSVPQHLDPSNVDMAGSPAFEITYWGQRNRGDQEQKLFPSSNKTTFQALNNNWYRATAGSITIPSGISLLRLFQISNVKGNWIRIAVRNHRIQRVSDTVNQAIYTEMRALSPQGPWSADIEEKLTTLTHKELTAAAHRLELQVIQRKLKRIGDGTETKKALEAVIAKINNLNSQLAEQNQIIKQEKSDFFNYWCCINSYPSSAIKNLNIDLLSQRTIGLDRRGEGICRSTREWGNEGREDVLSSMIKFEKLANTDNYTMITRTGKVLHATQENVRIRPISSAESPTKWRISTISKPFDAVLHCSIQTDFSGKEFALDLRNDNYTLVIHPTHRQENQQWIILKLDPELTPEAEAKISSIQVLINDLIGKIDNLQIEKKRLEAILGITEEEKMKINGRATIFQSKLNAINSEIDELVTPILEFIKPPKIKNSSLPQVAKRDVLLMAIRPNANSQLSAIETCEGNVQLNYFDRSGNPRQAHYDATADGRNLQMEEWVDDRSLVCLKCPKNTSGIKLTKELQIRSSWTIEIRFFFPFLDETTRLIESATGETILGIQDYFTLYTEVERKSYKCTYSLERLTVGWHHLTVVGCITEGQSTTIFYIDGQRVDSIPAQSSSVIARFGGARIAKVAIWEIALKQEEVTVHSKTELTGFEPGLQAYYPLNSITETTAHDATGNQNDGILENGALFSYGDAIVNLNTQALTFNGENSETGLRFTCPGELQGNAAFTICSWVRFLATKKRQSIVIFGYPNSNTGFHWLISNDEKRTAAFGFWGMTQNQFSMKEYEGKWIHIATTYQPKGAEGTSNLLTTYVNGKAVSQAKPTTDSAISSNHADSRFQIGQAINGESSFKGSLRDLHIWKTALSENDIQTCMNQTLLGIEKDLIVYLPLNRMIPSVQDTARQLDATLNQAEGLSITLAHDNATMFYNEYATISKQSQQKVAMMRRFLGYLTPQGVSVLPDKRVEVLELAWIGNAQFAPTLLGYIEGAPPVPSENLTRSDEYNGATSVQLSASKDMTFSWMRSQDLGFGLDARLFAGIDYETQLMTAVISNKLAKTRAGLDADLSINKGFQRDSHIMTRSSLSATDSLELRGSIELEPKFPELGARFIPKNIGYALVISSLADVLITRLSRSKRMVSYEIRPVEDIPPDINTITFLINPAYTMNGSLDGLTGSSATSNRFFSHVPEMRSQYGSLYPASYYRLQEAYDLTQQIDRADKQRESYFAQFNSFEVDETSLSRQTNLPTTPNFVVVNRPGETNSKPPESDAEKKAAADKIQQAATMNAQKEQDQLKKNSDEYEQRIRDIRSKHTDPDKQEHASSCFVDWQNRMENIQALAGKHNIVNTYVWDADGGLRAEIQSFASTAEHSVGGSVSLDLGLGFDGIGATTFATVEFGIQARFNLNQVSTKTAEVSTGIELNVDLSGVESIGITDFRDNPLMPGEKVDRYRFMSFYLEGNINHFHDFFNYVVDPEWLDSNDEEARSLKEVQIGKANKTWRVLHRVTYVERPALMGFGQDPYQISLRSKGEKREVLNKLEELEKANKELEEKINLVIDLLQKKD